ncbi:calcium:proton antiporter [Porphyrobacter sp. GA68]|uniref:calcium:proton antiporter n=1 Tax=Porphyrobacter sp. GA68 TaxID=2883480 RepID=UPI001D1950ED|nr:ionic transporter y4hA [Porphyrobacter sp. GA68]
MDGSLPDLATGSRNPLVEDRRPVLPKGLTRLPAWALLLPVFGLGAWLLNMVTAGAVPALLMAPLLVGCVIAAVHHAEVVAQRVGEPFGTLVLAVSVTVIEVSLIVSLMLSEAGDASTLARDTVVAAIMLILTGMLGASFLLGGLRHGEQRLSLPGVSAGLSTLAALAVLVLALPNFTISEPGAFYSPAQLLFVAAVSLILYATYVMVQTVRHRHYFLPDQDTGTRDLEVARPSGRLSLAALATLLVALTAVILLATAIAPTVERAVLAAGLPLAIVAVVIAGMVLAPESLAAVRAARRNRLQTSVNLAFGSALATIGLTIPTVAVVSLLFELPLALGVGPKTMTLLALAMFVTAVGLASGRSTVLQGMVHLVILAVYLFTTIIP